MLNTLELLAPAKTELVGIAAINHGADAVYIGSPLFGARKMAGNSLQAIEKLVNYAHIYNARVFVTLNTIIYEHELESAEKLIHQIYNIGADAIIIQDMGILEMNLPPIEIHASTQANNYNVHQLVFLEKVGIKRAVLARELSVNEIKRIREYTNIELECFVHGALCVSLSGQCYISDSKGNRSANRGECGQACRMKYNVTNTNNQTLLTQKHVLSMRDLQMGEHIVPLAKAGVNSFKIEGRLKDEQYVKNVVSQYRKILDDFITQNPEYRKASSGTSYPVFIPDFSKSFNRQFTNYFAGNRTQNMASFHTPKSYGEYLGTVVQSKGNRLQINTFDTIANGDGLCFVDEHGELVGFRVEKNEQSHLVISENLNIKPGSQIYRNHNHTFTKQLENSTDIRKITCWVTAININESIQLTATDCDQNTVELILPAASEKAKNQLLIKDMFNKHFTGATDSWFKIEQFTWNVTCDTGFYRIAQANEFRRNLLQLLLQKRINNYQRTTFTIQPNNEPFYKNTLDYRFNVANSLAKKFYARHGAAVAEMAPEVTKNYEGVNLMTMRYCLKFEMGICEKKQLRIPAAENSTLYIENKFGKYQLDFDCAICRMYVRPYKP